MHRWLLASSSRVCARKSHADRGHIHDYRYATSTRPMESGWLTAGAARECLTNCIATPCSDSLLCSRNLPLSSFIGARVSPDTLCNAYSPAQLAVGARVLLRSNLHGSPPVAYLHAHGLVRSPTSEYCGV